jgi:2-iminobutanoate/2-iminopropanoate deaminase
MTQRARQWQPVTLGPDVPTPVGAYSAAVRAGGFVFVSGQVPRDPQTGALIGEDVETQTKAVVANLERVLVSAGAALTDIVSITVYLADIDDWGKFNTAYKALMPSPFPTRTAVGAGLHGFMVEISAVAYVGKEG